MTQQPDKFTRREVERSFRTFRDIVGDLMAAKFQTWGDTFDRLVAHCETDAVMQVITEPLRTDPRVDANKLMKSLKPLEPSPKSARQSHRA